MSSLRYRTIKNKVFFYTTCFLASLTVIPLFAIIWELIKKGYKQINWNFFTESAPSTLDAMLARGTGDIIPGGIANGITGTLLMVVLAAIIAIPIGRHPPLGTPKDQIFEHHSFLDRSDSR